MSDKLIYIPNDDTQNTPAALAEGYTNILGMSSSQVNIRWIRTGSQLYYPHNVRGKLSIKRCFKSLNPLNHL